MVFFLRKYRTLGPTRVDLPQGLDCSFFVKRCPGGGHDQNRSSGVPLPLREYFSSHNVYSQSFASAASIWINNSIFCDKVHLKVIPSDRTTYLPPTLVHSNFSADL